MSLSNDAENEMDLEALSNINELGDESDVSDSDGSQSVGDFHEEEGESHQKIAHKENQLVEFSKILVVVVILVVAAGIGYGTHSYVSNQEHEEFNRQFDNVANDIIVSTDSRAHVVFDNMESVSISLTNQALAMNMTWPMVTFSNFQVTGLVSNNITGANTMYIAPLVKHEEREDYLNYSLRNLWWMDEAHAYDKEVSEHVYVEQRFYDEPKVELPYPRIPYNESGVFPFIWSTIQGPPGPAEDNDYYFPISQVAPAEDFSPTVNLDLIGIPGSKPYVQGVLTFEKPLLSVTIQAAFLQNSYDRRFPRSGNPIPYTYVYQPIFDGFKRDRKVAGIMAVLLPWDRFFVNILPPSERGIYVVVGGTCDDQQFTFKLSGVHAEFIGRGDLHDRKFSDTGKAYELAPFSRLEATEGTKSCSYTTRIYPSSEYSEQFFTNEPYIFTAAVVGCFLITTVVFIGYDIVVGMRQKKVMETAAKTHAIVTQLYPSNVRGRLLAELDESDTKKTSFNQNVDSSDSTPDLNCSSHHDRSARDKVTKGTCATSEKIFGSKPIADLFPSATIMFADMVGFTSWSSSREPAQVFTLLETVYHAFDAIAKRRRVFKVETIGDCYVACAGLPTARKDHAVVMARFADEIRQEMKAVIQNLTSVLGSDCAQLCMRAGLHSGAVTAGILRGEKGRFQLFGDTMNTASRMESTSLPNRIQLSKETADCLRELGKDKWVVEREDKVHAKGKGELQTYWLEIIKREKAVEGSYRTVVDAGLSQCLQD